MVDEGEGGSPKAGVGRKRSSGRREEAAGREKKKK